MSTQVAVFAMHRDHNLRLHQSMHGFKIRAIGMARHMIGARGIIHHIHTNFRQLVDDLNHATLIARNGF